MSAGWCSQDAAHGGCACWQLVVPPVQTSTRLRPAHPTDENVVYLFLVHPYDIGEVLLVDAEQYTVGMAREQALA